MSDDDQYEDYEDDPNSGKCFCRDNGNLPFKMEITHLQHVPFVCSFYHHPQQMPVTRTKIATNAAHHPPRIAAAKSFIPPSENPPKKVDVKEKACPNDLPTRV